MSLWKQILLTFQEWLIIFCTILAFVIPFTIYKINQKLHEYGDPPWKKEE
ncbi:hypothetical protein [Lentibacillus saliphilus]|nr:hypothetical protein [Lentibacillus saliphilus]